MRRFSIFLILAFSVHLAGVAQEVLPSDPAAVKINEYFEELAKHGKFNGGVLVADGDRVILKRAYNLSPGVPGMTTTVDSQFMIASVNKLLVKYAFLKLEEQKRIRLDDPIRKFIPGFPNGDRITVNHLIDHTSGLPRELKARESLADVNVEKVVQLARDEKLQFEPGTDTLYSNVGYQMLIHILNRAAPGGYEKFLHKSILDPFRMTDTYEYNYRKPKKLVAGLMTKNKKFILADEGELRKFESGRYYSTVDDMYRFGRGLLNTRHTSKAIIDRMVNKNGDVVHAGSIDGYKSYFFVNPKTGESYIFLSNLNEIPLVQVTKDIPNIVAGRPYRIPVGTNRVAVAVNEEVLKRYAGVYTLKIDRNQNVDLRVDGGKLYVMDDNGKKVELFAESETVFFTDPQSDDIFEFIFDEKGKVYTLFLTVQGGIRLEAERSK